MKLRETEWNELFPYFSRWYNYLRPEKELCERLKQPSSNLFYKAAQDLEYFLARFKSHIVQWVALTMDLVENGVV